jgi:hypothetical protein
MPCHTAWGKLFILDASGLRPLLIRHRDVKIDGTNGYDLRAGTFSSDGSWLAVTGRAECMGTSGICGPRDENVTTLYDWTGTARLTVPGVVQFSPNGRWLATAMRGWLDTRIRLFDLTSMAEVQLDPQSAARSHG